MTDQEPDRGKRKRPYRQRVICGVCKKELDSDYKDNHANTVHKGQKVAFTMVRERNQSQLAFFTKSSAESRPSQKLFRSDNRLTHMTKITLVPVGMYKLMALKELKSRLCRWFWNCRMTKMNTSVFRKLLCVR